MTRIGFRDPDGPYGRTRCPHAAEINDGDLDVLVGTDKCQQCAHFCGISRTAHEVGCSYPKTPPARLRAYFDEFEANCTHRGLRGDNEMICTAKPKKRVTGQPQYFEPCCEAVCAIWKRWRRDGDV